MPANADPSESAEPAGSRRERLRRQTLGEIKEHALGQVADGGAAALSLNAIGKAMGMSGPAIYRYFPSRDAVLSALVTDGYAQLTAVLEQADAGARRRTPERRLEVLAEAYRTWATAQPQLYALLFGLRPAGYEDGDEAIAAIQGAMEVLLRTIGAIAVGPRPRRPRDALDEQLLRWAASRGSTGAGEDPDPLVLRLGVLTWTRLHGLLGLELAGILGDMDLDPVALLAAELRTVVDAASGPGDPA
ncbi:TetR/AcrR family transcriptional regulator [Patulibacter sp.]|uniref:TetR/AcrR family transcriptional regulator n=1 Tax=Patulibacter sp. TaxID=1912859 RepID=UPI00271B98EE|nr:TetR/AcrR family transcriptional regulator [Patulibacter sp.]MDO9409574.1 TetR/AcrR family transcriptional regulator [Patulibacter sp.]